MFQQTAGIAGTGPAGLMAGTLLAENGWKVHFYDHKKAPGRKLLVAGHGGFNLTHSEPAETFGTRYDHALIREAFRTFDNQQFITFLKRLGVETYAGSSGKIFPLPTMKPNEVLQLWINYLKQLGAVFHFEHELSGFSTGSLHFVHREKSITFSCDAVILALGGASWPVTGSTGNWTRLFREKNIPISLFQSSNSGFELQQEFLQQELAGKWIKNIRIFSDQLEKQGELVLTSYGIEGAAVYALNRDYRQGKKIYIDFKPSMNTAQISEKLRNSKTISQGLRDLKIHELFRNWLKQQLSKSTYTDPEQLAGFMKQFELPISGLRPVEEVISTVGGLPMDAINADFELKMLNGVYCIGEMLDWDAPTGGYLIQGCVSSGYLAAQSILKKSMPITR